MPSKITIELVKNDGSEFNDLSAASLKHSKQIECQCDPLDPRCSTLLENIKKITIHF